MSDKKDETIDPDSAYIETPCQVARELLDPREAGWLCESCDRNIIDISALTRVEAAEFHARTAGQDLCIGYEHDEEGHIEYAPPRRLVPVSRLLRGVQGGALALALAACDGGADAKPAPAPEPAQTEPKAAVEPEAAQVPPPTPQKPEAHALGTEESGGAKAQDTDGAAAEPAGGETGAVHEKPAQEPPAQTKKKTKQRPKVGKRAQKKMPFD